jgi:hypothetical protein
MVPEVFREIMNADPEVLLRSDVATADANDRAALVGALLQLFDEEKLLDRDWDMHKRYKKLAHPGLADQLRPYISDRTKGVVVRRVAIDIAEACELQTLQDDFVDITFDLSQPIHIREQAAYAISRIGDEETKAKLKPLAFGEVGDDPNDALRGCALMSVWPKHMTANELFARLRPPKRKNLIGSYHVFLTYELTPHLTPDDLPEALKWVEDLPNRHELPYPFMKPMDAIMLKAWEHLDSPGVLEAFAKAALSRLEHYDEIVGNGVDAPIRKMLISYDIKRRQILETIVPLIPDQKKHTASWLLCARTPVVLSKDVPWMIERLQSSTSEKDLRIWAELIGRARDWSEPGQLDIVLIACQESPVLAEEFAWLIKPVELGSPEAKRMKDTYIKWQDHNQERPLLEPPPQERINRLLDQCESGNSAAWWQLNREMTLEPDSTHYGDEYEADLTVLPGWKMAEAPTKARMLDAARKYVLEHVPETDEWLGKNIFHRPAVAGLRALILLLKEDPGFISSISTIVWKRWAPSVLASPTEFQSGDEKPHTELVKIAYQHAPEEIISALLIMIDKENSQFGHINITQRVRECWNDKLAKASLAKAKDKKLKPKCIGDLLSDLLEHRVNGAREFAESLISLPLPKTGKRRQRAIVAARVLMNHAEDGGWTIVWPAFQQDTKFGREVVTEVAHGPERHEGSVGQRLTEDQLADLYIWLVRQFPYAEDPEHEGIHRVESRESVGRWKDSLLYQLRMRGTPKACMEIRRIAHELPELDWLKWTLLEAQLITRQKTWEPPQPADILELGREQQARLVQSGEQLLDVLTESLKRLEAKLHGETPTIRALWDRVKRNVFRPIDEEEFSDYLKVHLDEDLRERGIIVNREVRIHRGERTDIHVDAVIRGQNGDTYDSVTVIIEVKGCWHPELKHAMETQLVDRYLKDNHCQHGLYLIGWFNCEKWDNDDYRNDQARELTLDEAQKQFDTQATELSQGETKIKALVINTALR